MNRILVVEDDRYLNKLICDHLLLHDFQVDSVLDGEAAWQLLQSQLSPPYDIILVDMLLPKMMGAELLTQINNSDQFNHLKKYAMSGIYRDASEVDQISSLHNISRYWTKPLDLDDLVREISGKAQENQRPNLKGQLSQFPIERVYFQAYDQAFTGRLVLRPGDRERRVYIFNGHPVGAESTAISESFGESLVGMGFVTPEQRQEASERMVQNRTFLGESLLDLGHIEGDALFRALRQHTQSLILKTLFSRHGEFEFERLDELPSHLPLLELNPFLLMLQAQRRLLSHEALRALFELRMDQYPILRERMIQILPLLNLSPDSLSEFSKLAGDQTFANWISGIDSSFHEETLRGLYLMESIDLLTWASQPKESMDSSQVRRMDFSADFRAKSAVLNDEKLMAEYMDLLNKNYYELLEVSPESSVSDIEQAYRKRRLERHPDQFGETLSGQSKRMLDDILSRLDHAFQTLSHSEARRTYDSRIAKRANDSAADSKRFLAAQDLFRQATKYLESEDFLKAKELFERAFATWKPGVEYKIYALFAEFKSAKKSETQSKAVSILQKMRELTYSHSSSERGFVLLGHAHRALEQNNAARDAYRRALEINPSLEEAVNALATLATEEHQSKRAARGFQTLKPFILKGSLFLIFLLSLMGGWQMREEFFPTDRMATRLDPETAKLSFSAVQIRFKDQVAKVTVKSGELQKMPEPVLRSKCRQSLEKMSMYGARQLFLIDEEVGLFAICSYEKTQIFKPRDRSP